MIFLANENFPLPSIQLLREAGFDVISISEDFLGISDDEVIKMAKNDNLIIITFDKDYGEIIFKKNLDNPPSVIFFRFKGKNPEASGILLIDLLKEEMLNVENKFTVIEEGNIRQRTYQSL